MSTIIFITPPDAKYGFSLTGLKQYTVRENEAEEILMKIVRDLNRGLIIVDERLLGNISEERLRLIEQTWQGILLALPSPERPGLGVEDYTARLIRRAIGYHVRLQI